jgi:hypothetical protein|nr:MAG TPA: hypothetical protein [Bacteriophage sp.]
MKIKAKNPKISSMKLIVPIDGEISIDANGVTDVSPKCAIALVTGTNDWNYASKVKNAVDEATEEGETEDDDEGANEREELEAKLKTMSMAELKAMATEGEFPVEEWEKISSKKLLAAYLLQKYDEATEEGDEEE